MRWILLILGGLLTADTVFASMLCNMNLGVILPAVLGLPLLLIGIFWHPALAFFALRWGRAVKWALISVYLLFILSFAVVTGHIVGRISDQPEPGADAVIVLGAAVHGDRPSLTFAARLDCAKEYLDANPDARVILTGGQGQGENIAEAEAGKQYLIGRGLDENRIEMETSSVSTEENLVNARVILKEKFPENPKIVVVSSDFHLYRAFLTAKKLGMDVETLGNPSVFYLLPNFYLREYTAVLGYRILGRLG